MKKVIITIIFASTVSTLFSQFFFTIEPQFMRPGIMYNHDRFAKIGIYGKVWYGNIKGKKVPRNVFYTDNIKFGAGLSTTFEGLRIYAGANYNWFFNTIENPEVCRLDRIKRFSFDVGVSFTHGRFTMLMMTDFLNWESLFGFSYDLFRKQRIYNRKYLIK